METTKVLKKRAVMTAMASEGWDMFGKDLLLQM